MNRAVIYLPRFSSAAAKVAACLSADLVEYSSTVFREVFDQYREIAAVMSVGITVRGIAPLVRDKWTDPAVVVVTPDLQLAIPVLGGHHGANDMARELAALGTLPIITTATERAGVQSVEGIATGGKYEVVNRDSSKTVNAAFLDGTARVFAVEGPALVIGGPDVAFLVGRGEYSIGIGSRKGIPAGTVEMVIRQSLETIGIRPDEVMIYATTVKKSHEQGILDAVRALGGALIYLDDQVLSEYPPVSSSGAPRIGLEGVAEPCALAVSKRGELVLQKVAKEGVTVAIAR
jgi:cobalt-precorrin 5A hydrolase